MYLVIILFALFASLFTLQKGALNFSEPFFLVGFRMSLAGILLLAYAKFTHKSKKFKLAHLKTLILLSLFQIYLANICEIWSLKYMASSKACLFFSLSPFLSALIAFVALKEKISYKKWLGMIIGFIGLIPILFNQTQQEFFSGNIFMFSYAELALLIAIASSVYGWIALKKIIQDLDYSPIFANGISMFIGGILALLHSFLIGENWTPFPIKINSTIQFLSLSILMCIISNIICYNLYGILLKRFTATFMSFAGLITPLFASLFGFIFLQESISWHYFASMGFFIVGLTIFHQEEIKLGSI